jgi:hypothetical protein
MSVLYFAGLYDPLAKEAMEAIGDLMDSVGGVIEGLITSANIFSAADHASTHGATGSPKKVAVPSYGPERFERSSSASDPGYQDLESWTGNPVAAALAMPVHDPIGTLTAWMPKGHQDRLISAAGAWRGIASEIQTFSTDLDAVLTALTVDESVKKTPRGGRYPGLLTDAQVSQWRSAMQKFCNKIWGSGPWGTGGLPPHPLGLAGVCAEKLAAMCDEHRQAIDAARSALKTEITEAVLVTVIGILLSEVTVGISDALAMLIDEDMVKECIAILVDTYYKPIEHIEQTWDLLTLRSRLERALAAAPSIVYMEAQAESVGTRSLHDFRYPGMRATPPQAKGGGSPKSFATKAYTGWGDPADMPTYPIDLAGQEGTGKSHVLDKHVGLTNAQLLARVDGKDLSDPSNGSSAFANLADAQTYVQQTIDLPKNQQTINDWLDGPHNGSPAQDQRTINLTPDDGFTGNPGQVVVDDNGVHKVIAAHSVRAVLKYNKDLDPPFYVYTAFPTK